MQLKKLEILAPAKNREIGIAAINCGADSLYIGGPSFGARESAGNSIKEIEQLVSYAKRYGVKVYMVINTLLYDHELESALTQAHQAHQAGCDALIIQDLSLLNLPLPAMPLFASTQTNIRSVEQAKFLESLGFSRLILARELSLEQIGAIRDATTVELESFVHGALCVSYSGECYISSRVTGRSGNRGECAQICRNNFDLLNREGKTILKNRPLLSLKDLNLSSYIPQLASAGISSLKIEGRLKEAPYVKNIVRYYRAAVDSFLANNLNYTSPSYGKIVGGFTPRAQSTFNRGYTSLFVEGKRGGWNSGALAKGLGEKIGVITKTFRNREGNLEFSYSSNVKLANGDGLCLLSPKGEILGVRASITTEDRVVTNQKREIEMGSTIYRNYDKEFEKELEINMPQRVIEVSLNFEISGSNISIKALSEDGREVNLSFDTVFEQARDAQKARETIFNQLQKGTAPYSFKIVEYRVDQALFIPLSILNGWRRELASLLDQEAVKYKKGLSEPIPFYGISKEVLKEKPLSGVITSYKNNIANSKARELYTALGATVEGVAFEIEPPKEAELMRCKYCIKYELNLCPYKKRDEGSSIKFDSSLVVEPLYLENNGKRFRVGFDCKKCEMVIFG